MARRPRSRRQRIRLLETATEKIGRILSENYGIRVVYKHDMCCTDGKTIFLPVLGDSASETLVDAIPGMIDHESAHVLSTDFTVLDRLARGNDDHKAKLKALLNVTEDARIERFMIKRWRGTKVNLKKTHDWGYAELMRDWDKLTDWGKFTQICGVLACHDDDFWAGQQMAQREPELWDWGLKVKDMLRTAADLPDTEAAMKLARDVLDKVHDLADPPPPPPQPQQGGDDDQQQGGDDDDEQQQGDSSGAQGEDDSDDSGKPQSGGQDDEEGDDEASGASGDDQDDEDAEGEDQDDSSGGDGDSEDDTSDAPDCLKSDFDPSEEDQENDAQVGDRQQQIRRAAKATCPQRSGQYLVYSTERDVLDPVTGGDRTEMMRLLNDSRHITHVMRQKMMRNLIAVTNCRWEPHQERGRINPRALHRVVTGTSKKVFRKRIEAPKFDTRALLMVDHSYSMKGRKLRLASASALLFGEVLNQLGIPFAVYGFSTSTSHYEGERIYRNASDEDRRTFTRWGGLWIGVYKAFEDDWNASKHRCVNMGRNQRHNTFDGESVRLGAQHLLRYPEKRRILFLFNDGEPCPNVSDFYYVHNDYAKDVAAEVEKAVELFAVGIESTSVADFYNNAVCINSLEDLPKAMIGELDRLLKKMQRQLMAG